MERLGREDRDLTSLVRDSDTRVRPPGPGGHAASRGAVSRLPSHAAPDRAHAASKVNELGQVAGPAFGALRPPIRRIDDANAELTPAGREGRRRSCASRCARSCARARPYLRNLGPAARDLGTASPTCARASSSSTASSTSPAYNPGGKEALTGDRAQDLARDEGMLFWLGWVSHNTNSMFSTSDASGPVPPLHPARHLHRLPAAPAREQGAAAPIVEDALGVKDLLSDSDLCPRLMIKQTPSLGRIIAMVGFTLSVLRAPALPLAVLRRPGAAQARGLPLRGLLPRGQPAGGGGRRPHRRPERGQGQGQASSTPRAARTIVEMELDEQVRADPGGHPGAAAHQGAARRDLRGAHARHGRRPDARGRRHACRKAAIKEAVEIDEIISLFDKETRERLPGLDPRAGHGHRQGPRRGPERRARQPAALRGHRRGRAAGARRGGAGAAPAGAQLRPHAGRRQRAPRPAARADRQRQRHLRRAGLAQRRRWPRRSSSSRPSSTSRRPRLPGCKTFSTDTRPLVRDLQPVARDLRPTLRDVGDLAPDLEALFRNLDPIIDESDDTLPSAARFIARRGAAVRGAAPLPRRAQPVPVLPQLPAAAGGRLHHERRRLAQRHAARR